MNGWWCLIAAGLSACGGGGADPANPSTAVIPSTAAIPSTPVAGVEVDASVAAPTKPGWTLVWSDEFSQAGLPSPSKWVYDTERNALGWYNNELQYYAKERLENSRVESGRLIIEARRERLSSAPDFGGQNYTSARLITRGRAQWTYGLWEVRAKLPCGLGTWPAIWMLGAGGQWPDDGEIDIMEQKGTFSADKQMVLGTVHTQAYNWRGGTLGVAKGASTSLPTACTEFNVYQMRWSEDGIVFAVNGVDYYEFTNPKDGDRRRWPFSAPQYLLLNLAIGGELGGAVNDAELPAQFEVDYVRVYQRSPSPTGF